MKKKFISVLLSSILAVSMFGGGLVLNSNSIELANALQNEASTISSNASDANSTTIYFTNDVHGYFENVLNDNMSYATIAAMKKTKKDAGEKVYVVDAGDHVSGNLYANYDKGSTVSNIIASVGYDFRVPGNHEFDYSAKYFLENFAKNGYYACNFYDGTPSTRGTNKLDSYKVVDGVNGQKIAFIGVMTPETIAASAPGYFQDEHGNWTMYIDTATQPTTGALYNRVNECIQEIKTNYGQDTICIGVGHLGDEKAAVEEGRDSTTVVNNSHGLSAFIDGHSHNKVQKTIQDADGNNVVLVQAASGQSNNDTQNDALGINRLGCITIDGSGNIDAKILNYKDQEITEVVRDSGIATTEANWINQVKSVLSEEIIDNDITFKQGKEIQRTKCSNLSDLCVDSFTYYANNVKDDSGQYVGADFAIMNGGSVRKGIDAGTIKLSHCCDTVPFTNTLVVAELTGQQVLDALEYGAKDNPNQFAGLLHTSCLRYSIYENVESTVQTENSLWTGPPTGIYRVNNVQVYDKNLQQYVDLDLNKTYKVAGSDYLIGNSGDGFTMFKGANKHTYASQLIWKDFAYYLSHFTKNSTVNDLPYLSSATSPYKSDPAFSNYEINYENEDGANRIVQNTYTPTPKPEPSPVPQDDSASSSSTGDNTVAYMMFVIALVAGGSTVLTRKKILK